MCKSRMREIVLILVILVIGAACAVINQNFLRISNIANIFNSVAPIGIVSIGTTLIIATGNIDLSQGAQFYALSVLCAKLCLHFNGENGVLIFLISIVLGLLLGFINGLLIAGLRIPAIVVTLALSSIIRGVVLLITDGAMVVGLSGSFVKIAMMKIGPTYITTIFWIAISVITFVFIYKMRLGRQVLAMGGNRTAATRIGISEKKVYIFVFAFAGLLGGLAAPLYTSKVGSIQSSLGTGYDMKLITAAVIGGTAFSGGSLSLLGTFCGMLMLAIIDNMLVMMAVPLYWQSVTVGAILLIALIFATINQIGLGKSRKQDKEEKAVQEGDRNA